MPEEEAEKDMTDEEYKRITIQKIDYELAALKVVDDIVYTRKGVLIKGEELTNIIGIMEDVEEYIYQNGHHIPTV